MTDGALHERVQPTSPFSSFLVLPFLANCYKGLRTLMAP